jgi:F-type H+-transporting ATPase subunit gamma
LAGLSELRRHIRGVKNIAQVTRAMQMVSGSKMRGAQDQVLAHRGYVARAWRLLSHLAAVETGAEDRQLHPLLAERPVKRIELLLVTASRGFCGALNHTVIQRAAQFILEQSAPVRLVTVGPKGRDWMLHHGQRIVAEFAGVGDEATLSELGAPIAEVLMDDFERRDVDEVYMAYAEFVNTLIQKPVLSKLLPLPHDPSLGMHTRRAYTFEPDRQALLADLLPRLVQLQVLQVLREGMASEHSARMVAMREANENANEMLNDLTLMANRMRQRAITQDVIELSEGGLFVSPVE